jgi:hypothetical protein
VGFEDQDRSTVGNCGLYEESNDNGLRLIGLASALNVVIGSTMFPHKKIHLATWRFPHGTTNNQIDHILSDGRKKRLHKMKKKIMGEKKLNGYKNMMLKQ